MELRINIVEDTSFIGDLAWVVVSAGAVAVLFRLLRLPTLLGYLLAGLLIGPYLFKEALIHDQAIIHELSELGVVFLMFYIGLEFDVRKLRKVLGPAFAAIALQTLLMLSIGIFCGPMIGIGAVQGIFLGGILAISSSMVTVQVLRETEMFKHSHAQLAIGILILEDILAILLLVVLSGVAVSGKLDLNEVSRSAGLIGVFVIVVYIAGRILATPLLGVLHRFGSLEMITLITVAVALGVGLLAEQFHFSVALGAFMAGAIFSETTLAEDIEFTTMPLRSLFTAIFFVSVGMQIDPALVMKYWQEVLILSVALITGKALSVTCGLTFSGQHPRTSLRAALCKSQIGEFSFVIAGLGQHLGVTDARLTAITAGVAVVSIVATHPLSLAGPPFYNILRKASPSWLRSLLIMYRNMLIWAVLNLRESVLFRVLRRAVIGVVGYSMLFMICVLLGTFLAHVVLDAESPLWHSVVLWLGISLVSLLPIMVCARHLEALVMVLVEAFEKDENANRSRLKHRLFAASLGVSLTIYAAAMLAATSRYIPPWQPLAVYVLCLVASAVIFWKWLVRINSRIESMFLETFSEGPKSLEGHQGVEARKKIESGHPWSVRLVEAELSLESFASGKRIKELGMPSVGSAMILAVCRGGMTFFDPGPEAPLFPGDRVMILGEEKEAKAAAELLSKEKYGRGNVGTDGEFCIHQAVVNDASILHGETLAGSNVRRRFSISIIGIEREGLRNVSPKASDIIQQGDVLLVAGNAHSVERFGKEAGCRLLSMEPKQDRVTSESDHIAGHALD